MTEAAHEGVHFERRGAVAILTLDRPDVGNAIDVPLARALMEAALTCSTDASIRAVLLRANGGLFSAGGNIGAFAAAGERLPALILEVTSYLHSAIARLARMDKPLVTAINGFAAGAGFGLAMLGDIVIAGRSAQFTLAYTGIGFTPDGGGSWLLPRIVGLRKAQEMILLNTRLSAEEALAAGLITRLVDDDALPAESLALAQRLAEGPTRAFSRVRDLLLGSYGQTLETHMEREAQAIARSAAEIDGREGIAAFLAKRPPNFVGSG